jgi:hypothetical protein
MSSALLPRHRWCAARTGRMARMTHEHEGPAHQEKWGYVPTPDCNN